MPRTRTCWLTWVRTDSHQLRSVAAESAQGEAVKVLTRMHKTLIWERTRQVQRLRHVLRVLRVIVGARVLAQFGDAPGRYAGTKARKNYAGTSPITRASGKKEEGRSGPVRARCLVCVSSQRRWRGGESTHPPRRTRAR
jgi:hypothetical protein